jgi:hypothetical protein
MVQKIRVFLVFVVFLLLINGCANSLNNSISLSAKKYLQMESCVDLTTENYIKRNDLNGYNYGDILKSCSPEYGSLAVARYADGLSPIPYEFWQLRVMKKLQEAKQANAEKAATQKQSASESNFMSAYYALQGRLVIVNTAFEKCPTEYASDGKVSVHKNNLSQIREILLESNEFIELRDREVGRNLKSLIDEFKRISSTEFIKTVDGMFTTEKLSSVCAKALNADGTEEALSEFIVALSKLEKEQLGTESRRALHKIKLKIVAIINTFHQV